MKIDRFEEIKAWQEARKLVKLVYDITKSSSNLSSDYKLKEQMQSAAVSIMSNIAEGFSRRSTKEFTQFLFIAKGSSAELQSQLYVALDQGYISKNKFSDLYVKSDEVARLISGFLQYLLSKDKLKLDKLNELKQLNKQGALGKQGNV